MTTLQLKRLARLYGHFGPEALTLAQLSIVTHDAHVSWQFICLRNAVELRHGACVSPRNLT